MKRTVSEWIEEYMYDCKCRQLRPKTMQSYEQTLKRKMNSISFMQPRRSLGILIRW